MGAKKSGPTAAQLRLVERCREQGYVMYDAGEQKFHLAGGAAVNRRTVEICLERGLLIETGDSMFGTTSQTILVPAPEPEAVDD